MERVEDPLEEQGPLVLIEIVMGPSEGWGRIWSAYSLRSFLRRLR
jgi:hypothetical protein